MIHFRNNIVASNTALPRDPSDGRSTTDDVFGSYDSEGHNLIGKLGFEGSQADYTGISGYDLQNVSPDFELDAANGNRPFLKDNGGGTLTIAINSTSAAVNAGNSTLSEDQRGYRRGGRGNDIGAFEIVNPPVIKSLTLSPEAPTKGQAIVATVVAEDPDGPTQFQFSYVWTRTRAGKTETLPNTGSELSGDVPTITGDIITVTATATDGQFFSAPVSTGVTVVNAPISLSSIKLQPSQPYTFDKLFVTVKSADVDETRAFYTYVWTKNGAETKIVTHSRSSQNFYDLKTLGLGDKGDVIEVTVTATDGPTTATAKASATIRNSVPVLSLLTLTPEAPTPQNVITSNFGGRDADGDKLTKLYIWKIGKKVLVEEKGSRLNLAKYPFVKAGDVVSLEMRLSDGEALSRTRIAQVTVVAATPPAALSAPLTSSGETSGNAS